MNPLLNFVLNTAGRLIFRFRRFGNGSVIKPMWRRVSGTKYISIGANCYFGDGLVLVATDEYQNVRHQPSCTIGDRCVFGSDTFISCTSSIVIESNVLTSSRVFIGDSHHGYEDVSRPILDQPMAGGEPIKIGEGSFLGIGSVILPGTVLGKGCVVSANCVVSGEFPDHTVIAAARGRVVRRYDAADGRWTSKTALSHPVTESGRQ